MENEVLKCIYGAGKYGKLLYKYLDNFMKIDCFVQTEEPLVKELEKIPVISFERMINTKGGVKLYLLL